MIGGFLDFASTPKGFVVTVIVLSLLLYPVASACVVKEQTPDGEPLPVPETIYRYPDFSHYASRIVDKTYKNVCYIYREGISCLPLREAE